MEWCNYFVAFIWLSAHYCKDFEHFDFLESWLSWDFRFNDGLDLQNASNSHEQSALEDRKIHGCDNFKCGFRFNAIQYGFQILITGTDWHGKKYIFLNGHSTVESVN